MKKLFFIIIAFYLNNLTIYCQNAIPYMQVVVLEDQFIRYFDQSEIKQIKKLKSAIAKNIRNEYRKAWNEYYKSRNNIKNVNPKQSADCIREAIDDLPTKLNATSQNPLWIKFGFSEGDYCGIYDYLGLKGRLKSDEYKGDEDGHGGFNGTDPRALYIYNAYKDYQYMIFQTERNGCIYKRLIPHILYNWKDKIDANLITFIKDIVFYFGKFFLVDLKDWHYIGEHTATLKSAIFHEMVHMALYYSSNARIADEATVEDTELKIFPGGNSYEYNFDYLSWSGEWGKGYRIKRVGRTKNALPFRKFNPPIEMKYDNKGLNIEFFNFRTNYYDDTFCDDARCESIFPKGRSLGTYRFPTKCCNQNK